MQIGELQLEMMRKNKEAFIKIANAPEDIVKFGSMDLEFLNISDEEKEKIKDSHFKLPL